MCSFSCIIFIVKFFQFSTSAAVCVLLVFPHYMRVDKNAAPNFPDEPKIHPLNLICMNGEQELRVNESEIPDLQIVINLKPEFHLINDEQMIKVAKCYEKANGTYPVDYGCFCFASFYIAGAVILAIASVIYSLLDCILLCASKGKSIIQGGCAIAVTLGMTLGWSGAGAAVMCFIYLRWPFSYYTNDNVRKQLFISPLYYLIGAGLCFFFSLLSTIECIAYIVVTCQDQKQAKKGKKGKKKKGTKSTKSTKSTTTSGTQKQSKMSKESTVASSTITLKKGGNNDSQTSKRNESKTTTKQSAREKLKSGSPKTSARSEIFQSKRQEVAASPPKKSKKSAGEGKSGSMQNQYMIMSAQK